MAVDIRCLIAKPYIHTTESLIVTSTLKRERFDHEEYSIDCP